MEQEVITFLIENRREIMQEIMSNLSPDYSFRDNAVDVLKAIILRDFNLHIEDVYVILSDIDRFENDLNFFVRRGAYDGHQITN